MKKQKEKRKKEEKGINREEKGKIRRKKKENLGNFQDVWWEVFQDEWNTIHP